MKSLNLATSAFYYYQQYANYQKLKGKHDIVLDPYINFAPVAFSNWAPAYMKVDEWEQAKPPKFRKVIVFVIDTAGQITHRDVAPLVLNQFGRDFTGEGLEDGNGHGTACASCYIGTQNGVADRTNTQVIPLKALQANGSGSYTWVANAIEYAVETYKIHFKNHLGIISMSLGGGGSSTAIARALDKADKAGMWVGASSGNSGYSETINRVNYPAKDKNAWAIGAITSAGKIASFSSAGEELVFTGPGQAVQVAWKGNGYINANGTSFGMPYAMAALSRVGTLFANPVGMADALPFLSRYATDLDKPGKDRGTGYGVPILDRYAKERPGGTPTPPPPTTPAPEPPTTPAPKPEPPSDPGKSKPRTLDLGFKGRWRIDWRNQGEQNAEPLFITELRISYRTKDFATGAYEDVEKAINKFFTNRGLILSVSRENMSDEELEASRVKEPQSVLKRPALFLLNREQSDFFDAATWTKRFLEIISRVDYKVDFKVVGMLAEDKDQRTVFIS